MRRIQAQLPDETVARLRAMSAQQGVSVSALLRRGADLLLRRVRIVDEAPEAFGA